MSYSKNYICKFMQIIWRHKLFHFHLFFWIWKVRKGRGKNTKFECLENKKSFLDEIKNIFRSLWRALIWWKNKNLKKLWTQDLERELLISLNASENILVFSDKKSWKIFQLLSMLKIWNIGKSFLSKFDQRIGFDRLFSPVQWIWEGWS